MLVYIVTKKYEETISIVRVFTDRKLAEEFTHSERAGYSIKEFECDQPMTEKVQKVYTCCYDSQTEKFTFGEKYELVQINYESYRNLGHNSYGRSSISMARAQQLAIRSFNNERF